MTAKGFQLSIKINLYLKMYNINKKLTSNSKNQVMCKLSLSQNRSATPPAKSFKWKKNNGDDI
jgi:hypothetical protein